MLHTHNSEEEATNAQQQEHEVLYEEDHDCAEDCAAIT